MNRIDGVPAPGRPRAAEDPTNRYFVHAVARRLLPLFQRMGISPNGVSMAGLAAGLAAAGFYYHYERPQFAVLGFLFMLAWHILDGADGQLARLTGRQSEFGKFVDGICDYGAMGAVYVSLTLADFRNEGDLAIFPIFLLAGGSHILQAALYERQRQFFTDCLNGSAPPAEAGAAPGDRSWRQAIWTVPLRLYLRVQSLNATNAKIQELCASDPDARQRFLRHYAPLMRWWNLLANNLRTLLIFLACLLASPLDYFIYLFSLANLFLVVLLMVQGKFDGKFLAEGM